MFCFKEGQIDRFLKLIDNQRHKLIVLLLIDCGIKVSDCVALKISDFAGTARTKYGKRVLKVKDNIISISDRCFVLLKKYVSGIKGLDSDSFLFRGNLPNKHLCRKSINKFLERFGKRYVEFSGVCPKALVGIGENKNNRGFLSWIKDFFWKEKNLKNKVEIQNVRHGRSELVNSAYNNKVINNLTFGRKNEIEEINDLLRKKVNVMILGGVGVGKSHLIDRVLKVFKNASSTNFLSRERINDQNSSKWGQFNGKVLRLDDCYEIKRSLINILLFLKKRGSTDANYIKNKSNYDGLIKHLQKDSIASLCDQIIEATERNEYLLVIDSCDRITPRGVKALERLKDHFVLLTAAREVSLNKASFLWNFEIVRLKNLERRFALGLIMELSIGMQIEDIWLFSNHIYEQSVGNPRVIHELVDRYRKEVVVSCDIIREVRHTGSLKEIDCSWFVIVFLGIISTMRFMSHEIGNDSLRFIGGCAVLVLLVARNLVSRKRKL